MRKVIIVCLMLIVSFLAEYIGCEAKTDDFVWRFFQPDWQWGEREWETPWEIVRELATDDIGKMPFNAKDYGADDEKVMGKTYHLSYKLNGGEMVGETVKTYRAYEREIKLPKAKRKGYIFTGWSFGKDHETTRLPLTGRRYASKEQEKKRFEFHYLTGRFMIIGKSPVCTRLERI